MVKKKKLENILGYIGIGAVIIMAVAMTLRILGVI